MNKQQFGVATGFAGAAALAAASQAYGAIIVLTPPTDLPAPSATAASSDFDVNADGGVEFTFASFGGAPPDTSFQEAIFTNLIGTYVVGYTGPFYDYASRLTAGTTIGPANAFVDGNYTDSYRAILTSQFAGTTYGDFQNGRGFLGFQFLNNGVINYGYVELSADQANGVQFFSAAYDDSGAAIAAGAVPEPGSLAALAAGAAALVVRRPRRKSVAVLN